MLQINYCDKHCEERSCPKSGFLHTFQQYLVSLSIMKTQFMYFASLFSLEQTNFFSHSFPLQVLPQERERVSFLRESTKNVRAVRNIR
jgi:hypothetical protein